MTRGSSNRNRIGAALAIFATAAVVTVQPSAPVGAATTITVDTLSDSGAIDGQCSLQEAITAANTDTAVDTCPAGTGADVIEFSVSGTVEMAGALPTITTPIHIDGNGNRIDANQTSRVITIDSATVTIDDLTLTGGSSSTGGGINNRLGVVTVANTTISDNTAQFGGGIFNNGGTYTLINTTVSGNTASNMGGGISTSGTVVVRSSTITDNTAPGGAGISSSGDAFTFTTIEASIVAANNGAGNDVDLRGGTTDSFRSNGYNVLGTVGANITAFPDTGDLTDTDPLVGPLADNGGLTHTHALLAGSPAIDLVTIPSGDAPATDQRGLSRPQAAANDAGAYEAFCLASPWRVANPADLNAAISCFNAITIPGDHDIDIVNDIVLDDTRTTGIDNETNGLNLTINGNGNTIDANQTDRVFSISTTRGNSVTIDDVTLTGGNGVFGGGILNFGGAVTVSNTTITGNTAVANGGGIWNGQGAVSSWGPITVTNSTISNNTAPKGGGIWNGFNSTVTVTSSTITGNTATTSGGGIYNSAVAGADTAIVRSSTVTDNTAPVGAGISSSGDTSTTIEASIVAANDGAGRDLELDGGSTDSFISNGYNVLGTIDADIAAFAATGDLTDTDPLLGPLADTGGPTHTHALLAGSPAIDHVTTPSPQAPTTDQRGITRPQATANDAGAHEADDTDGDDRVDVDDNCPSTSNAGQKDVDGDGTGDACDPADDRVVFESLTPARFADSRDQPTFDNRYRNTGPRPGGSTWEIPIAGRGSVPADATAAIVNLTIVGGTGPGFATVHPCGTLPNASSVNYGVGDVEPNEVIAKLSATGTICVFTLTTAHVIVDVVGHVTDSPYQPLSPRRYADSRDEPTFDAKQRNTGLRGGGTTWEIPIAGRGQVPASATTAVVNLTVTGGTGPGFATVHPCGTLPNASSLNYGPGITRPNELVAKLSSTGTICVYTLTDVHVIVDVVGYLDDVPGYTPLTPARYADSRDEPTFDAKQRNTGLRGGGTTWEIPIAGRGQVPATATAAVVNLTVTGGTGPGFATIHPCGTLPNASSLNYNIGITRPNEAIASLSPTGTICVYTLTDVHVIVDVVGHT